MTIANLNTSEITQSSPPHILVEWLDATGMVAANSVSSELIELSLPGLDNDAASYLEFPRTNMLTGRSYAMQLLSFGIHCDSSAYTVIALDVNDMSRIGTLNEVLRIVNINRMEVDEKFYHYVIRNRDNPQQNKLYVYIENNDGANSTGTITIQITYINLQDREFS